LTSPPDTVAPAPSPRQRARLIFVLGALTAFGPLSIDMYLPGLPALASTFDAPAWAAQLTLTACLAGLALGQIVAGPLSDRFGRRVPVLLGVGAYAVLSALCALAPSVFPLVGLRLLQGLAGAAGIVIARAVVRDLHSGHEAARFFSLLMLVNGAAPILAPVLGGQILGVTSWRGVFVVLAAIGVLLLAASAWALPETLAPERRHPGGVADTLRTFGRLLRDRTFLGYALACGLCFGAMFAYIAGSPFVLQEIYGASPQLYSFIFAVNALGIVGASQANRALVGRFEPRAIARGAQATQALAGLALLVAVAVGTGVWPVVILLFVVVASLGLVMPNATALALADHPEVAGSASGLLGVMQFMVGAAAAPLVGVGGTDTALPMAAAIASPCAPRAPWPRARERGAAPRARARCHARRRARSARSRARAARPPSRCRAACAARRSRG
jgi:DHA1 family bicyclomycin/chloramphenicol resistance-like MFS transporter